MWVPLSKLFAVPRTHRFPTKCFQQGFGRTQRRHSRGATSYFPFSIPTATNYLFFRRKKIHLTSYSCSLFSTSFFYIVKTFKKFNMCVKKTKSCSLSRMLLATFQERNTSVVCSHSGALELQWWEVKKSSSKTFYFPPEFNWSLCKTTTICAEHSSDR